MPSPPERPRQAAFTAALECDQIDPDTEALALAGEHDRPRLAVVHQGVDRQREVIEMLFAYRISLIASALGPAPAWMVERGRVKGVQVAVLAGTVEHARRHAEAGTDTMERLDEWVGGG